MKNITNTIITSETTTAAREAYITAAKEAAAAALKKKTLKEHKTAQRLAAQAHTKYNQDIQADTFAAILKIDTAPAIVTLSEVGYYSAAVGLDKKGEVEFAPAPLSLHAFIEYAAENGVQVSSPDTYAGAVKDTVDLSILKLAQGLEDEDVVALSARLEASDSVKEYAGVKCTETTPESIGYGLVEKHLQAAIDALVFVAREDNTNTYRVKRSDVRWLEASYGVNRTTGKIVNPENTTRYEKIFRIMRRVIGGEVYAVEVKEKKEGKKESK